MIHQRIKNLLVGASEMLFAVVLVLSFFLVLMGAMILAFPRGTGLRNLYSDLVLPGGGEAGLTLGGAAEPWEFVARLSEVRRQVKQRPASAVAWKEASQGMSIGDRHAIQTLARSGAAIVFQEKSELRLDENSLVVIRRPTDRFRLRRKRATMVVLSGRVRGTVAPATKGEPVLDFVTAGAETRVLPAQDGPAEFSVTVNPDDSSTVQVFSGTAEVTVGDRTAVIDADHALTVTAGQPLGAPERIPQAPRLSAPPDGMQRVFGALAPRVEFRWSGPESLDGYRLVIARDPAFEDPVHEEQLSGTGFVHGNLDEGSYYWRVSGVRSGSDGPPSSVRSFRMVEDLEPPALEIALPESVVNAYELLIEGRTEPGAEILIGAERVPSDEQGRFAHTVSLRPGPNVVVVEAVDAAGNVAYRSGHVNAVVRQ